MPWDKAMLWGRNTSFWVIWGHFHVGRNLVCSSQDKGIIFTFQWNQDIQNSWYLKHYDMLQRISCWGWLEAKDWNEHHTMPIHYSVVSGFKVASVGQDFTWNFKQYSQLMQCICPLRCNTLLQPVLSQYLLLLLLFFFHLKLFYSQELLLKGFCSLSPLSIWTFLKRKRPNIC